MTNSTKRDLELTREITATISDEIGSHILKWNRDICEVIIANHIQSALAQARQDGRDSVLNEIPKARAIVFKKIWNGHNTPTFDETFNATVDYFLAKLKEQE